MKAARFSGTAANNIAQKSNEASDTVISWAMVPALLIPCLLVIGVWTNETEQTWLGSHKGTEKLNESGLRQLW